MLGKIKQTTKNPQESATLQASLEYEPVPDAEERLTRIFEFLLQDSPVENTFLDLPKVV